MMRQLPAIEGGESVREEYLPFSRPLISDDEIEEVIDTLKSGWLSMGQKTLLFEERFKGYIGTSYAIALNSCTAALHLALLVAGVGEEDEVITTPLTFCATSNVILYLGAKPVFVDVGMEDYNIDPKEVEAKITQKTKAIVLVHLYGHPCKMGELLPLAQRYGLRVISDCAHAIEAEYKGHKVGAMGDLSCFSFYATKNLTTGEGGMITTNDPELERRLRVLRLHGLSADAWKRYKKEGEVHYDVELLGYKYNMTDIQAALGLKQLEKIDLYHKRREEYWKMYNEAFADVEEILRPPSLGNITHSYHLYSILIRKEVLRIGRDEFSKALHKEGIGTSVHYTPLHLFSLYKERFGFKGGEFPNAEYIGANVLCLPLFPAMRREDVEDVIEAVKKIVKYYRR